MTRSSPSATIAIVLMPRRITIELVIVRNVFGLLTSEKTMITRMIANASPPMRRNASHARPAIRRLPEADAAAAAAGLEGSAVIDRRSVVEGRRMDGGRATKGSP